MTSQDIADERRTASSDRGRRHQVVSLLMGLWGDAEIGLVGNGSCVKSAPTESKGPVRFLSLPWTQPRPNSQTVVRYKQLCDLLRYFVAIRRIGKYVKAPGHVAGCRRSKWNMSR